MLFRSMAKVRGGKVDASLVNRLAAPRGCYFLSWKKPPSRIIKSVVVVNKDRDDSGINHCLLEELTQSLGLPNDSDMMRPSLFSDRDRLYELSPTDTILLRTLYDPRMKPGLPRTAALAVARKIMAELDDQGSAPATSPAPGG